MSNSKANKRQYISDDSFLGFKKKKSINRQSTPPRVEYILSEKLESRAVEKVFDFLFNQVREELEK